jgi:hypothetical protein
VRLPHRGGSAAKRQSCGFSRRLWRHGFPDGIRPARVGHVALEGDDDFGDCFYVDVDFVVDHGDQEYGRGRVEHNFGTASGEDRASPEPDADPDRSAALGSGTSAGEFGSEACPRASAGKEIVFSKRPNNAEVAELADALA